MNDPVLAQALAALDSADVAVSDDAGCTDLLGAIRKVRRPHRRPNAHRHRP